jgi:ribosomal protein S18 acetylase RimI-like enzyme
MSRAQVTIRDARPGETDMVTALWRAAYGSAPPRSIQEDIPVLLNHGPAARLLLAEDDGRVAGSLIVTFDGWRGNMYRLAVHPDYTRRGIASRLVEEAHAWLREQGCRRITALVEGDHDYATSFWESAGYRHDEGMRRYSYDFA